MGRMHSDAQFAGSSSVPAHVEMMGLIGMGNNPMVGAKMCIRDRIEHDLTGNLAARIHPFVGKGGRGLAAKKKIEAVCPVCGGDGDDTVRLWMQQL